MSSGYATGGGSRSPLTTKGDVYVFGTTNDRLPVGANGQIPVANSADPLGITWGAPAGGSGATENGTSIRLGSGTSFVNNVRFTVYGINAGSAVGQDNTFIGYNVKGGTVSGSYNTYAGDRINELANNISGSVILGSLLQPYVSNQTAIIGNSSGATIDLRTSGVIVGNVITQPASGTWNGSIGYQVIVGSAINDSNVTPAQKRNILIGGSIDLSAHTNTLRAVVISYGPTLAAGIQQSVAIGDAVQITGGQSNCTVVGPGARAFLDATYGTGGGEQVSLGYNTYTGAWRATAIGGYAQALSVSSTVIGFGGYANKSHGSVLGRGGFNDIQNAALFYTGASGLDKFYFGGIGAKWTNPAMPGTEVVNMSAALNAGTVITRFYGVSGRDTDAVPTLTNIRGGHVRHLGGESTGTAVGGEFQVATTPASGVASNTLNAEVVCASFDASAYSAGVVDTRFMLLDLSTGTLKRVLFGANDSGGAGYKYLKVAN